jgi:hypothetical protein
MYGPRDGCYDQTIEIDPDAIRHFVKKYGISWPEATKVVKEYLDELEKNLTENPTLHSRMKMRAKVGT